MTYRKLHVPVQPDQSAAIPYRVRDGVIEVLLVTTKGGSKWIVPKGGIERGEEPHASAEREALEEAGVEGNISAVSLGCYRHGRTKKSPVVEVFLMHVERELEEWPENEERSRRWASIEEVYKDVKEAGLKSILDEALTLIQSTISPGATEGDAWHPALPQEPTLSPAEPER